MKDCHRKTFDILKVHSFNYFFLELGSDKIKQFDKTQTIRPIELRDFMDSLKRVRHSLSLASLTSFEKWNREYGDVSL